mgnify:CR=1 FL=1
MGYIIYSEYANFHAKNENFHEGPKGPPLVCFQLSCPRKIFWNFDKSFEPLYTSPGRPVIELSGLRKLNWKKQPKQLSEIAKS